MLSWGQISSAIGLSGCTGIDVKLVHGNQWQQIEGDLTTNIGSNETRNVVGNQDLTTAGNVEETIVGNLTTTIIGAELHTNMSVQNHTRAAPRTEVHMGSKQQSEPGMFMRAITNLWENHTFEFKGLAIRLQLMGTSTEITAHRLQCIMNDTKVKSAEVGGYILKNDVQALKNLATAVKNQVNGVAMVARAMEASAQTRVQAPPEAMVGPGITG